MVEKIYSIEVANEFAYAIINQAIEDYKTALINLQNKNPTYMDKNRAKINARFMKDDCEIFFKSDWCNLLSPVDGEKIMNIVRKQLNWDEERYQGKKEWWKE